MLYGTRQHPCLAANRLGGSLIVTSHNYQSNSRPSAALDGGLHLLSRGVMHPHHPYQRQLSLVLRGDLHSIQRCRAPFDMMDVDELCLQNLPP